MDIPLLKNFCQNEIKNAKPCSSILGKIGDHGIKCGMKIGRSGVSKLSTMMENISSEAGLSHIYTNHSFRATAINLWANSGLTNREIMAISGHRNESNVQSYHSIPSVKQLRICSEVLCTALGHDDKVDEQPANLMISMTPLQQLPFSSVNTAISATHQNTAPFRQMFTSCTIGSIFLFLSIFRLYIDSYTQCRHFYCNSRISEV